MLTIKVFGPGCPNCRKVEEAAKAALGTVRQRHPKVEAAIEKVKDPLQIMEHGVLKTPGLAINERLLCQGRIPRVEEVEAWILEALSRA
jgi:small redox-active disulfide protein 2